MARKPKTEGAKMDLTCAYCDGPAEGNYDIHVDERGFLGTADVPLVPLCDEHGSKPTPTCEQIWDRIAERKEAANGAKA